jgi:hypothetical protein
MNRGTLSLRALQLVSLVSAAIAISGGGTFVLLGSAGLAVVVGAEYSSLSPVLEQAVSNIEPEVRATFDTWYRALGWYWLMTGVMLLWIIPSVQYRTDWFRFLHMGFMAVGIASIFTIADSGTNLHNRYGAVAFELGIPVLLMLWQRSVALAYTGRRHGGSEGEYCSEAEV